MPYCPPASSNPSVVDVNPCLLHAVAQPPAGNLLVPQEPFELLVRRAVNMLLPPAIACKVRALDSRRPWPQLGRALL